MNESASTDTEQDQAQDTEQEKDQIATQPTRIVERGGTRFTILGTAHVSKTSADEVERLLETGDFDAVAIELDENRYASITEPDRVAQMDLFQIFRQGKAGMMAASLALGAFQQRLADQMGIQPGEEFRVAIRTANAKNLPILLIDRDIGVTLRRTASNIPWWQRFMLFGGLLTSVVSREEISEEEIENLKEGDMLEATFTEFAEKSESIYTPLIAERDEFMALKLREAQAKAYQDVLVVIGAGHLRGLVSHLQAADVTPSTRLPELNRLPKGTPWLKILPWIIVALIITGFVIGFSRSPELGVKLLRDWVLINGTLAALGAAIATAHPLTVVASFFAAPLTSLNPLIGAGFVAAGVELWLRKPKMEDFSHLRQAVTTVRGWWQNRVARTLLVFFLASLGSALGTYIAGFKIIDRLFG